MSASAHSFSVNFVPLGRVYFPSDPGEPNFEKISETIITKDAIAIPCQTHAILFQ